MILEGVPKLSWRTNTQCCFVGALASALARTEHPVGERDLSGLTALAFLPIAMWLAAMVGYNMWRTPQESLTWAAFGAGGLILTAAVMTIAHMAEPLFRGRETHRRAIPITWRMCLLSLAAGAGVVAGGLLAFPAGSASPPLSPPSVKFPKAHVWWFKDEGNYAGSFVDPADIANACVFWRIDGRAGHRPLDPTDFAAKADWSAELGKLVILGSRRVQAAGPDGRFETIFDSGDLLMLSGAFSSDGRRLVAAAADPNAKQSIAIAVDLKSATNAMEQVAALPLGMVFLSPSRAVASVGDELLYVSQDEAGQWHFQRQTNPSPGGYVVGTWQGHEVLWEPPSADGADAAGLVWRGRTIPLPEVTDRIVCREGQLLAVSGSGAAHLVDESLNVSQVLWARGDDARLAGLGSSDAGFWVAYDDGQVIVIGADGTTEGSRR